MRARKPSSAGADDLGRLWRDACFFSAAGGGPSDGLLFVGFRRASDFCPPTRLGDLVDPALVRRASLPSASLESEEEVGAVREEGSLAGLVGDLGRGLTKPVEDGMEGFFVAVLTRAVGAAGLVVVVEALVVFSAADLEALDAAVVVVLVLDLAEVLETGVFGSAGDLLDFDRVEVLVVEIGAGLEDLPVAALSLALAEEAVLSLPVVTPLRSSPIPEAPFRALPPETASSLFVSAGRSFALRSSTVDGLSGFPVGVSAAGGIGSFGSIVGVPCLLAALEGISRANSGIVSETSMLFFRALNSAWMDFFLSMTTSGSVVSFSAKLPRRCDMVESSGGTVVSFLKPHCMPDCPFRSTATKLVRTFDSGRGDALLFPAWPRVS